MEKKTQLRREFVETFVHQAGLSEMS